MSKHLRLAATAGLLACATNVSALDTSAPFLCAVAQVNECLDGFGCEEVLPEMVGAPTFIWVDLKKDRIRSNQNSSGAKIANHVEIDGRHILQGAEDGNPEATDGAGWTLSIEDSTGRFAGAITIQQATLSLFGACTELP
jgi:hypothetical protein